MKLWMKHFVSVRAGQTQSTETKHKCDLPQQFEKRRNALTKELYSKNLIAQNVQAVFITSAVLSITCCLFSTSVQSSLRARCLPSLRARCLRYEDAVFVTCILSFTCTLSSLRAHRPRYAHTVFVTCILSSLRARCLRYVHTVFVTCILSVTYILSSLRAYCLRYIHTVFVTCILSVTCTLSSLRAHCLRYVHTVFVTCAQSSLPLTSWENITTAYRKSLQSSLRTTVAVTAEQIAAVFSVHLRSTQLHCLSICS